MFPHEQRLYSIQFSDAFVKISIFEGRGSLGRTFINITIMKVQLYYCIKHTYILQLR